MLAVRGRCESKRKCTSTVRLQNDLHRTVDLQHDAETKYRSSTQRALSSCLSEERRRFHNPHERLYA